jgi:hypothetical protein
MNACASDALRPNRHARDQLRIGVHRDPEPHRTRARNLRGNLRRDVALLAVVERPEFIDLNPTAGEIPHHAILILGRHRASFDQQPRHSLFRHAGHRTVERIEQPSIKAFRTAVRVLASRRFMVR